MEELPCLQITPWYFFHLTSLKLSPLAPKLQAPYHYHLQPMALLNYISVTSTTTPISQDPPTPAVPDQRQTKILLPKKKPLKWSTGVAPGDYGGPPTTSKLRKYWGGEKDPLSSDDFMWNKDFMGRFQKLIQNPDASIEDTPIKVFVFVIFFSYLPSLLVIGHLGFLKCFWYVYSFNFLISLLNLSLEYYSIWLIEDEWIHMFHQN